MMNGLTMAGPTAVHSQNYQSTPPRSLPAQETSGTYRPQPAAQPTQSVISIDDSVPYSRGVDRSEVLNSKFLNTYYNRNNTFCGYAAISVDISVNICMLTSLSM